MKSQLQLPIWTPSQQQIDQCCHFFIATTIVALSFIFSGRASIGFLLVLAWAVPKEFAFDLLVEKDTVSDSRTVLPGMWSAALVAVVVLGLISWLAPGLLYESKK